MHRNPIDAVNMSETKQRLERQKDDTVTGDLALCGPLDNYSIAEAVPKSDVAKALLDSRYHWLRIRCFLYNVVAVIPDHRPDWNEVDRYLGESIGAVNCALCQTGFDTTKRDDGHCTRCPICIGKGPAFRCGNPGSTWRAVSGAKTYQDAYWAANSMLELLWEVSSSSRASISLDYSTRTNIQRAAKRLVAAVKAKAWAEAEAKAKMEAEAMAKMEAAASMEKADRIEKLKHAIHAGSIVTNSNVPTFEMVITAVDRTHATENVRMFNGDWLSWEAFVSRGYRIR